MLAGGRPKKSPSVLKVRAELGPGDWRTFEFTQTFRIGRLEECDISINDEYVSREHAEATLEDGQWWIRDLGSSNGLYVGEKRVQAVPLADGMTASLGFHGPKLYFEIQPDSERRRYPIAGSDTTLTHYIDRYFSKASDGQPMGEHTILLRKAYARVQAAQRRKYATIIIVLVAIALGMGIYAVVEHKQTLRQRALAEELFYSMKALDLDIANLERQVADSNSRTGAQEVKQYRERRKQMEKGYDNYLAALQVYSPRMSERDRIVLRTARIFGECELDMPPGFVGEVNRYIKKWQSSDRFAKAIQLANERGYTKHISEELLAEGLPPEFFYLALQESNFDPYAVGPLTRKGYAKGIWQFIPETAVKYGLRLGPLADQNRPDPRDDRDHEDRATKAAAKYLKDLYSTDAQASGLLVMASYNWGENQVLPMVRSMPANPRERNFWKLLANHRDQIPQETYDYVFSIASAAAIGENPRLFGFDFDNPLSSIN